MRGAIEPGQGARGQGPEARGQGPGADRLAPLRLRRALSASVDERNRKNGFVLQNGCNAKPVGRGSTRIHADKQRTRYDKLGSFCKIPAAGMQTAGAMEMSSNWLIGRRLRHGNGGIEGRGWHLLGR